MFRHSHYKEHTLSFLVFLSCFGSEGFKGLNSVPSLTPCYLQKSERRTCYFCLKNWKGKDGQTRKPSESLGVTSGSHESA